MSEEKMSLEELYKQSIKIIKDGQVIRRRQRHDCAFPREGDAHAGLG
jgi:hypothetical protein